MIDLQPSSHGHPTEASTLPLRTAFYPISPPQLTTETLDTDSLRPYLITAGPCYLQACIFISNSYRLYFRHPYTQAYLPTAGRRPSACGRPYQ